MTSFPYTNISVYLVRYLLWGQLQRLIAVQEPCRGVTQGNQSSAVPGERWLCSRSGEQSGPLWMHVYLTQLVYQTGWWGPQAAHIIRGSDGMPGWEDTCRTRKCIRVAHIHPSAALHPLRSPSQGPHPLSQPLISTAILSPKSGLAKYQGQVD